MSEFCLLLFVQADSDADKFLSQVTSFQDVVDEVQRYRQLIAKIQYVPEKVRFSSCISCVL